MRPTMDRPASRNRAHARSSPNSPTALVAAEVGRAACVDELEVDELGVDAVELGLEAEVRRRGRRGRRGHEESFAGSSRWDVRGKGCRATGSATRARRSLWTS